MDGKAERRWLGTSPCDNERTTALRTYALRAYDGKSSELIPPGPRSRFGTTSTTTTAGTTVLQLLLLLVLWRAGYVDTVNVRSHMPTMKIC